MTLFRVFSGNRLDFLARELAGQLALNPPSSPFDKEIIIVQSLGMERWLSMQLASAMGICANCRFDFPNAFVGWICKSVFPEVQDTSLFEPRFLAWRIMELLPSFLDDPRFVALRNYLGEPVHNLKLLQLSERIANTFDQYTVYRPEFITDWNSGKGDEWQAVLWRGLSEGHEHENRAVLGRMLLSRLDTAAVAGPNGYGEGSGWSEVLEGQGRTGEFALPHRVSVFGISYLPPFHIQVLQSLSRLTEVNLFVLNPCREYWGNITAERQIGRIAFGTGSGSLSAEDLHLESGNSLLASMGKLGRDFFGLITSFDCEEYSSFEPPGESDLLSCIRSDILDLKESREATGSPVSVAASDRSVEIHSCHGPMREVEVLYDHLLEMFESIPSLAPRDIVVMAPDIELYAPLVQAVFDSPGEEKMRVPYNIADRSVRKESNVINAFLSILDLWGERITASKVMGILESEQVRRRFEISDEDLDLILKWVGEVRIKWGLDEKEKLKWCRTAYRENTWMAGIERLLLGYAMPGRDRNTFCGILPYDHLEGSETLVLGNFLNFLHHLFGLLESVERPRTLTDWDQLLLGMISDFFIEDEDSRDEIQALRRAIGDLRRIRKVSGYSGELDMPVMKWYLSRFAGGESFGHGFLTGGVTFCSMLPMRSIPFKVVCLIGMNENAFPRQSKPLEFDLMAKDPRPGDRSLRNDDRYLFLEALISAETRLYISYTGQSSRDNSVMPPSVLVSELMDYIRKNFRKENSGDETWFLTRHRLQPFNPAYFTGDSKLFSYSDEHLAQACSLTRDKREPADFISDGLPPADESMRTVSVADLRRFFSNPAKFLLNRRLGVYLGEESYLLDDAECFEMGRLEQYSLTSDLITHALAGVRPAERHEIIKARGVLPHGTPGQNLFTTLCADVETFLSQAGVYLDSERLDPLSIDITAGEFRVVGTIEPVYRDRMVHFRYATIKAKDLLNAWIAHLLLNASRRPGYPGETIVVGGKADERQAYRFRPLDNAGDLILELLCFYWDGLSKPLHFFPEASLAYAQAVQNSRPGEDPLRAAEKRWKAGFGIPGEGEEAHLGFCFRSGPPLDREFEAASLAVFGPLIGCREKV